jgi:fermentation-respiration switch protein FrsA (DUF1100 family)
MMGGAKAHYDGIKAFSETDQTEDLKAISVPTLVLHGEDDQIVPIADSALKSVKLLKNGTLKTYPGFSHGMLTVNADVLNADLLAFIKGGSLHTPALPWTASGERRIRSRATDDLEAGRHRRSNQLKAKPPSWSTDQRSIATPGTSAST